MNRANYTGGRRLIVASLALSAVALPALLYAYSHQRARFYFAYLTGFNYVATTAVGGLILLMSCHAVRATWPVVIQRFMEAIAGLMPLVAVGFLPLLTGIGTLYPWARPSSIADERARALVELRLGYLNSHAYTLRAAAYLVIWTVVMTLLRHWSARMDRTESPGLRHRLYVFSAALLPAVALALAFASFDWGMTLNAGWISTMFPVYYFAGGFLAAIALVTLLSAIGDETGALDVVTRSHYYALGRLLLAFTIFWAYAAFFQFMLIWMADRPDESSYYLARFAGRWKAATLALVLIHFVVPFVVLLSYRIKQTRGPLSGAAAWLLMAHYLDMHWMVMPALGTSHIYSWVDFAALAFWAGISTAYGTWLLRGHPLLPTGHPALREALEYESA